MTDDETLALLRRVAEALYGSQWHGDLARALDINMRTVQRWSAGEYLPAPGVWLELTDLMKARREELARLVSSLMRVRRSPRRAAKP